MDMSKEEVLEQIKSVYFNLYNATLSDIANKEYIKGILDNIDEDILMQDTDEAREIISEKIGWYLSETMKRMTTIFFEQVEKDYKEIVKANLTIIKGRKEETTNNNEYTYLECVELMKKGYFMKEQYFSPDQSMHMYDGDIYLEDGATFTINQVFKDPYLEHFKNGKYYIFANPDEVNITELKELHSIQNQDNLIISSKGLSFNNCIKR